VCDGSVEGVEQGDGGASSAATSGTGGDAVADGKHLAKVVPKVAIIGVHGVANHAPGATANAMADLLLSLPARDHDAPRYFPSFKTVGIQVPQQRLAVYSPTEKSAEPRTAFGRAFDFLQEQSASFARLTKGYVKRAGAVVSGFAGRELMRQMLYRYLGGADGDAYVTTRLEGERDAHAEGGAAKVHIYEVLWADLARPENSLLSFLLALLQLTFHLAGLSRLAIDTGAAWNSSTVWVAYRRTQRYAVRMFTIVIPVVNLLLLIALYAYIPAVLTPLKDQWWLPILLGAVGATGILFLLVQWRPTLTPSVRLGWVLAPAIAALVGGGLISGIVFRYPSLCIPVSVLELWLAGAGLLRWIFDLFGEVRRGVADVGWSLYVLSLALFLVYLLRGAGITEATLWVVQWLILILRLSWIALIIFAFVALVLGSRAWRSLQKNSPQQCQARAAVRTSRFALAIPSLLFLFISGLIWASLFGLGRKIHDPYLETSAVTAGPPGGRWLPQALLYRSNIRLPEKAPKPCAAAPDCTKARVQWESDSVDIRFFYPAKQDYLQGVLAWSITPGFPVLLGLGGAGFLLLVWWALPSVLTEKFPLRNSKQETAWENEQEPNSDAKKNHDKPEQDELDPPRSSTNKESSWLGSWISRGLDSMSYVVFLVWCSIFVAPLYFAYPANMRESLTKVTASLVGYFIAGTVAAALLAAIVKYAGGVLRIVLDVDTYLRTEPAEATPRAKIVERYVSLLRYLVRYRDPSDGRGYDSIVIVAHSLGTLISADLLRFLHEEGDPALAPIGLAGMSVEKQGGVPIKFLTMGSPIRQLLNRFFPYLYDWAQACPDNGLRPLPEQIISPPPNIAPNALPDPSELGVTKWVNMYRSGDYVGRSLWLTEWYRRTDGDNDHGAYPEPIYVAQDGSRAEMCIGAGAHTHYWDDTAPDVAEQLNDLI